MMPKRKWKRCRPPWVYRGRATGLDEWQITHSGSEAMRWAESRNWIVERRRQWAPGSRDPQWKA